MLTSALPLALGMLVAAASAPDTGAARRAAFNAEDVLAKSRAAYAALTSYADSGTVADEASGFTAHSTFRILFTRKPHQLLIESRIVESRYKNGHRIPLDRHVVLWLEDGDLQTWHSRSQAHETYPADGGQQVNALKGAALSPRPGSPSSFPRSCMPSRRFPARCSPPRRPRRTASRR